MALRGFINIKDYWRKNPNEALKFFRLMKAENPKKYRQLKDAITVADKKRPDAMVSTGNRPITPARVNGVYRKGKELSFQDRRYRAEERAKRILEQDYQIKPGYSGPILSKMRYLETKNILPMVAAAPAVADQVRRNTKSKKGS